MFLQPLQNDWSPRTAWCAPTAFALLTGCTLASAHERFAFIQDQALADVSGVAMTNLLSALSMEGKTCKPVDLLARYPEHKYGPTLERYMRERPTWEEQCLPLLILVHEHVLTASGQWMADNWTKRPVPVDSFPKLKRTVDQVWVVT